MLEYKKIGNKLNVLMDGYVGFDFTVPDVQDMVNAAENVESVTLQINSGGGLIFDGWAMYNIIKNIKDKLDVEVIGLAASMASVLALSGRSLKMRQGSYMMIHRASSGIYGDAQDMRDGAELLEKMEEDILNLYDSRSALNKDEIKDLMLAETWINAEEALEYGFADSIDTNTTAMAACVTSDFVNKIPEGFKFNVKNIELNKKIEKKEKEKVEEITNISVAENKSDININNGDIKIMDENKKDIVDVDEIVNKVMAKIPTGRSLEANTEPTNKIDNWFKDYLVSKIEPKNATVKTSDGYGVPTLVDADVFKRRSLGSFMRRVIEGLSPAKIRTYSADIKVTAKVNPTAAIIAEGADYANGSDAGSTVTFDSIKMGSIYSATEEVSEDSLINVVADFTDDAGRALAKLENDYFVVGSGVDEPEGMVTGGTVTVASSGLSTTGFSTTAGEAYAALVDFDEKLPEEYREGSFYMMNSAVRAGLRKIVDSNKRPILQEYANGLFSLFGRPVIINDNMDTFGASKNVMLLGNREGYGIGDRASGLKVRVSENTKNGDTEVRWSLRTDGKVLDANAFQVLACPAT